jgi:hypothetical protein
MEVNNPSNIGEARSFTASNKKGKSKVSRTDGPVKRIQFSAMPDEYNQDQSEEPPRNTKQRPQLVSYLTDNKEPSRELRKTRKRQSNKVD